MADLPPWPPEPPTPVAGWREFTDLHLLQLLTEPLAYAVATAATKALTLQQEQIARLRAELDRYQGRTVYHCTDEQLPAAMAQCRDARTGDIVRATDTGTEFEARRESGAQDGLPAEVSWELRQ